MAGFEVTPYGRFCLYPEASGDEKLEAGQAREQSRIKARTLAHGYDYLEAGKLLREFVRVDSGVGEIFRLHAIKRGPVSESEGTVLVVVENCAAKQGHLLNV